MHVSLDSHNLINMFEYVYKISFYLKPKYYTYIIWIKTESMNLFSVFRFLQESYWCSNVYVHIHYLFSLHVRIQFSLKSMQCFFTMDHFVARWNFSDPCYVFLSNWPPLIYCSKSTLILALVLVDLSWGL